MSPAPSSSPPAARSFDPGLLPSPGESERCAVHAERIDLDPGGTALFVDELIVVDVALPWPKPVWAKEGFTEVPELVMAAEEAGRRVRVLAAVPLDDGVSRVVSHRLVDDARFDRAEHEVAEEEVISLLVRLLCDGLDAHDDSVVSREAVSELLLCTQGSHDVCCGSRGTALKLELEDIDPAMRIRRISHTGGHRMAPTGLTLPDGRMWGRVDCHEMAGVIDRSARPAAVAPRCRGWIGAPAGPGQVAERAVFEAVDSWEFDRTPRTITVVEHETGFTVEVATAEGAWEVEVVPGRDVPTIACGAPGGLPTKPGSEWLVESCEFRSPDTARNV